MSILQIRYCPRCATRTYHRFTSRLRCRFARKAGWLCVSCDKRERELRRRAASLGLAPGDAADPGSP
jgi:transposase-like protein